jgi:hypothetical protein
MHRDSVYFEQATIWASELTDAERACVDLVTRLWPADAATMLDVGAGAGRLLNNILVNASAIACDLSVTALKMIKAPSVSALVTALPFRDRSFDLSLCSNVLEHLTEPDLAGAFGELARISVKYVMIISPIGEPIETQLTVCRSCGCQFHPNGHRRRFKVPDFEAGLPEFATETVSFFGPPFLMASPLAAAAERSLGRDIHHYAGAICPNCNWVAPLTSPPDPTGPTLWDLGPPCPGDRPNDRVPGNAVPSSAVVLLRRSRRATARQTLPSPKLRISACGDAPLSVALAARPSTRVDLHERVGTLGPAILVGCVLLTPDSAWKPLSNRPDLRIEGGLENTYAIFSVPAAEVSASRELRLEVSGSLKPGIQVELHDTVRGYVGLGSIEPVERARRGKKRILAFKLPALPRPGGPNALFRLFRPAGSIGWIELHGIGIDSAPIPQTRPLTEAERVAGALDLIETFKRFGGSFAVQSEGGPVAVRVDATALGCRNGFIELGTGRFVTVPAWLAADRSLSARTIDLTTARAAARLGHDVGLLFRRQRSFTELEPGASGALIDAIAAATGETPAHVRDLLNTVATRPSDLAELEGRIAFLAAHAEAIEARRASTERLLEERDRTIAGLETNLTNFSDLLDTAEANRTTAERAALDAGQQITELETELAASWTHAEAIEARRASTEDLLSETRQRITELETELAASWTHADAIEARRAATERLLQERDRTVASLDGKLTELLDLLSNSEADRIAAEDKLAKLGEQLKEREAELRAALNRLAEFMIRYRWFEKIRRKLI